MSSILTGLQALIRRHSTIVAIATVLSVIAILGFGFLFFMRETFNKMMFEPTDADRFWIGQMVKRAFGDTAKVESVPLVNRDTGGHYAILNCKFESITAIETNGRPRPDIGESVWEMVFLDEQGKIRPGYLVPFSSSRMFLVIGYTGNVGFIERHFVEYSERARRGEPLY